jgi:signal transduction histidine kinase
MDGLKLRTSEEVAGADQGEETMSVSVAGRSRPSERRQVQPDTHQFKAFAVAIVVLTSLLLTLTGVMTSRQSPALPTLLSWIALVAVAGVIPVGSGRGPRLAMDLPLLLAAAFTFDPFAAGLIALAGSVDIRELRGEISLIRALWNRSQTALSVMAASVTFTALGGLQQWPQTPLVALVALASDGVVNYVIVGYGTSLRTGVSFADALRAMRIGSVRTFLLSYVCFGFLGVLIAEAHAVFGLVGVIGSLAPVVLGSQAFLHRFRLDRAEQSLAATSDALRRVDERIAEERRDERSRIAEALHDEVLQDLYNVTIRAQVLRQDLLSGRLLELEDDLPAVIRASEAAVEDLREVIHGLRSATIGHAGFVETLTLFANHLSSDSNVKVVLSLDPMIRSTPERELVLYQVAREALTNCIRHASARTVWVSLRRLGSGEVCELVVEDDGRGFDLGARNTDRHFGLELMKERAASISAQLDFRSSPGAGTVIELRFRP